MFDTLKRLFDSGRLPAANLKNAVVKKWITPEEYKTITGTDYTA